MYLKYFLSSDNSMDASRFDKLVRIAFSKDSPRPLEQLFQTTGIEIGYADSIVYDTSDVWDIFSGSPLLGELDGQTAIFGHLSIGPTNREDDEHPPKIDLSAAKIELRDWSRNIPGAVFARRYGLAAIPVE